MGLLFKIFGLSEHDTDQKKKDKDNNIDKSNLLSKEAQKSKDRFEQSLLELEELLKKQNA
jgi:hypothetical protein